MKLETVEDYKCEIKKALDDIPEIPDGTYEDMYFQVERSLHRLRMQLVRILRGESIILFDEDT